MKRLPLILFLVFTVASTVIFAQTSGSDCKVKVAVLQGTYSGDCAKGLAHGQGKAYGTDSYVGEFRKGLPHGAGTYTWANGDKHTGVWKKGKRHGKGKFTVTIAGRDSTLTGRWKKDKWVTPKVKKKATYTVTFRRNVLRSSFQKLEGKIQVEIIINTRGGSINAAITYFEYFEGYAVVDAERVYIEEPQFPLKAKLRYSYMRELATSPTDVEIHFTLLEPGNWRIIFSQ